MPFFRKSVEDQAVFNAAWDIRAINTLHSPLKSAYNDDIMSYSCSCECKSTDAHTRLLPHYSSFMVDFKYHFGPFFLKRRFKPSKHVNDPRVLFALNKDWIVALIKRVWLHDHLDSVEFAFVDLTLADHRHRLPD